MIIKQISVFLENSSGRIADVTNLLKENKINLRALMIADTADFGILRIVVDDYEKAMLCLKEARFTAKATDVLAVEIKDKIGSLSDVMSLFDYNDVNIEYLYSAFGDVASKTKIIFKVNDAEKGLKVLNG
ncbi:MAG: amino acid-binding protein [Treponemataceae bacterium]